MATKEHGGPTYTNPSSSRRAFSVRREGRAIMRTGSMLERANPHLLIALALAFVYHGGLLLTGTFRRTYDAYVHIFFADHYMRAWFDHWDYRWYTGFTVTSYPPGSQQSIALLAPFVGLLNGFVIVQLFAILMVTLGIYRFSKIWVSEEAAGYAALLLVFSSSIAETVHVFGQLPTMFSLGFLLNALPFARRWLDDGDWKMLLAAWGLNAATTAGHHVTTLFGAVFFVGPVIAAAIVDKFRQPIPDEPTQRPARVTFKNIRPLLVRRLRRILPVTFRAGVYGIGLITVLVFVVLPYWLYSRADPITQVPIPHASRDNFLVNRNAGLVFWLIPYGLTLVALPYAFYKGLTTRAWPMTLSLAMLVFLGTGGTTPFPRMLLGGAFDILTLDRFTFWATITVLPLLGEFVVSLRRRGLATYLREQFGPFLWRVVQVGLLIAYLLLSLGVANLTQFRRFQPAPIDMQPIVTFLEKDEHWRWRYLTLGFGDQFAWLSAQTTATSVDGNYHSARRLPELTTTPVERLEGSKFSGIPGIGSLQQFLGVPDKYNLKYVFSNDQFYDPLLFFSGWHRVQRLENGIMVWEREDIPPLPEVLPRKEIPVYQRMMWGIVPMTAIVIGLCVLSAPVWSGPVVRFAGHLRFGGAHKRRFVPRFGGLQRIWPALDRRFLRWSTLPAAHDTTEVPWQFWRSQMQRIPRPKPAAPTARQVRTAVLIIVSFIGVTSTVLWYVEQAREPVAIVQAYYDDLDFRRFGAAYERLDPQARPSFEEYQLQLSVTGGLLASYGKLDSVQAQIVSSEPERAVIDAKTVWITALSEYPTTERLTLVKRGAQWYILPQPLDVAVPPDQFFRRPDVDWGSQDRRRVTTESTAFGDVQDRPELQILSSRFVQVGERYSLVGELINTDVDPADVTVTALLYDDKGNLLTAYNAQTAIIHKIFPKEVTPFRIDFEGVAGAVLGDEVGEFRPDAYSPVNLVRPVAVAQVYAKAVVTGRDLQRDVAAQELRVELDATGRPLLRGELFNTGTIEAIIPHVLITYYDADNRVVWVDQAFIERSIRPQRAEQIAIAITPAASVVSAIDTVEAFPSAARSAGVRGDGGNELIALPPGLGYTSMRVSVNYLTGATE